MSNERIARAEPEVRPSRTITERERLKRIGDEDEDLIRGLQAGLRLAKCTVVPDPEADEQIENDRFRQSSAEESTRTKVTDRKALIIRLDEETHRALKRYAFEHDISIQAITEGLITDFLGQDA